MPHSLGRVTPTLCQCAQGPHIEMLADAEGEYIPFRFQSMDSAPMDGTRIVVRFTTERLMIARYSRPDSDWCDEAGAFLNRDRMVGWWPIPGQEVAAFLNNAG